MQRWAIGRVQLWRDYNAVVDAWVASVRLDVADPALDRLRALQRSALSNVIAFPTAARRLVARAREEDTHE